ncbi:hypothetical protein OZN62_05995 [Aurantiacibacter sp. MUD11]|uniref:hypothetical protein n=1 Tax=Aurantiacibacter sp. MUD11 TaxID=3003265 RepID=UPI0022AB133B|nr:hypothetical protein [Aurantiacibacter sp. MUD11]WAT19115.1 hypothetical protein OZN62_05995 [Aurantiacibacter sp. MUD11]
MSNVGGTYDFVANTPMGEQTGTFTVVPSEDGETFTGQLSGGMGSMDVQDGEIVGDKLTWKMKMGMPMPMTLDCEATVEGDAVTGKIKTPMFGAMDFTAQRQA